MHIELSLQCFLMRYEMICTVCQHRAHRPISCLYSSVQPSLDCMNTTPLSKWVSARFSKKQIKSVLPPIPMCTPATPNWTTKPKGNSIQRAFCTCDHLRNLSQPLGKPQIMHVLRLWCISENLKLFWATLFYLSITHSMLCSFVAPMNGNPSQNGHMLIQKS